MNSLELTEEINTECFKDDLYQQKMGRFAPFSLPLPLGFDSLYRLDLKEC